MKYDCLVLGAGMVGISTALHLQQRGRSVALIDRRPAAEETSYGNAGLIQAEAYMPYTFPRDLRRIIRYTFNLSSEANVHWSALPELAPFMFQYWRYGSRERTLQTARANAPLISRCIAAHEDLAQQAGATAMFRRQGYLRLHRHQAQLEADIASEQFAKENFGINYKPLTPAELAQLEPHLRGNFAGAVHIPDPISLADPGALGKAYAELFETRGGAFLTGDARTLEAIDGGWQVQNVEGPITARDCVICLGPWSGEVLKQIGISVPLAAKRGYHMHYATEGNATLNHPSLDTDFGFLITSATKGIRLTTGAEFARIDAPPTPVQLRKVEPEARKIFPLAHRVEDKPWLGRRPVLPDLLPMIGKFPGKTGLWANFAHQHHGLTLGPITGQLIAEMVTGEPTFCDSYPYRVDRF